MPLFRQQIEQSPSCSPQLGQVARMDHMFLQSIQDHLRPRAAGGVAMITGSNSATARPLSQRPYAPRAVYRGPWTARTPAGANPPGLLVTTSRDALLARSASLAPTRLCTLLISASLASTGTITCGPAAEASLT